LLTTIKLSEIRPTLADELGYSPAKYLVLFASVHHEAPGNPLPKHSVRLVAVCGLLLNAEPHDKEHVLGSHMV